VHQPGLGLCCARGGGVARGRPPHGSAAIIGQDLWMQRAMLISGSRRTLTFFDPTPAPAPAPAPVAAPAPPGDLPGG